ncbi:hypothetical protein STEG23_019433, partial [Scotinomys teguina]
MQSPLLEAYKGPVAHLRGPAVQQSTGAAGVQQSTGAAGALVSSAVDILGAGKFTPSAFFLQPPAMDATIVQNYFHTFYPSKEFLQLLTPQIRASSHLILTSSLSDTGQILSPYLTDEE